MVLHLGESTLEVPFSVPEAKNLGRSFNGLLQTFKDKQEAEQPKKWDNMAYIFEDQNTSEGVSKFEVVCNPNAFPSAFDAKLLISLQTNNGIKVTGEAYLSQLKADLQNFIQQHIATSEN